VKLLDRHNCEHIGNKLTDSCLMASRDYHTHLLNKQAVSYYIIVLLIIFVFIKKELLYYIYLDYIRFIC